MVLAWPRLRGLNVSVEEVREEVRASAKQRFAMKRKPEATAGDDGEAGKWLIRANQGHSINIASEGLHTPVTLEAGNIPEVVVHGTYFAFWERILASGGLKKMGRTHVHFGTGVPEDGGGQVHGEEDEDSGSGSKPKVISGMRADAEVLVFVDVEKSLRDGGIKWWLSDNGVVLSEGDETGTVPSRYFKEVRGRRQGVGLLWKDGEKVADLPENVVARKPMGKHRDAGRGQRGRGRGRGGRGGGRGGRGGMEV
ncbi:KptA family-domain-containing protein [Xylariaceae sp. FL0016]|nr:KptA family-domain-containing protein [Xylariaceae sp. FL0016]